MTKKLLLLSLLLAAGLTLSGCSQDNAGVKKTGAQASPESPKPKAEKIEVMNFHATQRCVSCSTLGKYSEDTVYEFFQPQLRDGIIEFKEFNVDLPENREITLKYQARGSSLFINAIYDGQDHIEEDVTVWRLLSNESQFKSYLKSKINSLFGK